MEYRRYTHYLPDKSPIGPTAARPVGASVRCSPLTRQFASPLPPASADTTSIRGTILCASATGERARIAVSSPPAHADDRSRSDASCSPSMASRSEVLSVVKLRVVCDVGHLASSLPKRESGITRTTKREGISRSRCSHLALTLAPLSECKIERGVSRIEELSRVLAACGGGGSDDRRLFGGPGFSSTGFSSAGFSSRRRSTAESGPAGRPPVSAGSRRSLQPPAQLGSGLHGNLPWRRRGARGIGHVIAQKAAQDAVGIPFSKSEAVYK